MSTTDPNQKRHASAAERYNTRRALVAANLRRLADEFERETEVSEFDRAFRNPAEIGLYGNAASRGVHAISWGFANLHLDTLIESASVADATAPRPEPQG